jgi:hypothetical protein
MKSEVKAGEGEGPDLEVSRSSEPGPPKPCRYPCADGGLATIIRQIESRLASLLTEVQDRELEPFE